MKLKDKKNIIVLPLILITLFVWGTIIYNIIAYYAAKKENNSETIDNKMNYQEENLKGPANDICRTEMFYKELDRDPFTMKNPIVVKKKNESKIALALHQQKVIPAKPEFKYKIIGTIVNSKSNLAILLDLDTEKTVYMREGDEYKGIEIRAIGSNKVIVSENKNTKEIQINN